MELLGLWTSILGIVIAFGALGFWCRDAYVTAEQEKVVAILIKFGCILILSGGCILILSGGCIELYFVCGVTR